MSLLQEPLQGFQGPSFTRPRSTAESLDLEEKPLKEEKEAGKIPMPEVQLQSKRIPPSLVLFCRSLQGERCLTQMNS